MKQLIFLFVSVVFINGTNAQTIQEVCASSTTNGTVVSFEEFGDTLYATGFFNTICGKSTNYVAKWVNNEWEPTTLQLSDPGHRLKAINGQLYVARYEESIDSNWVYIYDGNQLSKVGQGVYLTTASGFSELPNIYDIIEYNGKIIACGEFDRVGQQTINGIMEWDGTTWSPLGGGLTGNIVNTAPVIFPHQMLEHNGSIYVVGNFRYAGGIEVNGIAKWDGMNWSAMGTGFNGTVYSIALFNNEIVVGGSFTSSGGTTLNRIAKWDGMNWDTLGFGFTSTSPNDFIFVHTLKVINNELYVGGGLKEITFSDNTTLACGGIVSYDGQQVNTFNGGVAGNDIEAITLLDNQELLVGGGVFGSGYTGKTGFNINTHSLKDNSTVEIFPNPFHHTIHISTNGNFDNYTLLDYTGQMLQQGVFQEQLNFDVPAGMYILQLKNQNQTVSIKMIKE